MQIEFIYAILSVVAVSLLSVVMATPFFFKKKIPKNVLLLLLSLSVGTLLGSVFIHFLPESFGHEASILTSLYVLLGFIIFFILEKLVHMHHNHKCMGDIENCAHSHAYHIAPINLIGDAIHNFIDGLVIAAAYLVSIPLGLAATISILFHEIPQEMADFGILLYSGLSKAKALLFNLASAATAILGTIIGLAIANSIEGFTHIIIPFAAGNFVYIAASNLVPELHRQCKIKDSLIHILAIIVGIIIMLMLAFLGGHAHA